MDVAFLAGGLVALFLGGELLVHGAAHLARSFGVSTLLVGLTVVAVGTSMPELLTNLAAAFEGSSELALGNVVGSNVANIGLVLGSTGLIVALRVQDESVRWHIWFMSAATVVVALFLWDGRLARVEGAALLLTYVVYTAHSYRASRAAPHRPPDPAVAGAPSEDALRAAVVATGGTAARARQVVDADAHEEARESLDELELLDPVDAGRLDPATINRGTEVLRVLGGLVLLAIGAALTVRGAIGIADAIGIPELVIGLTVVALGTSLPELVASILSARRGHAELGIGNAVGSNIANLLLVLGVTSMVLPITADPADLRVEWIAMLGFALVLIPMARDRIFTRRESTLLLAGYVAFTVLAVVGI